MITLNGKKLASNDNEFTNSLFQYGGTCIGYYKVNKRTVSILDHNKNKVGVISNLVLGKATKQENGGYWYSYGDVDIIGPYDSYLQQCEEIQAITRRFNLPVKY